MNSLVIQLLKRTVFGVLTLLAISIIIFVGVQALPGDVAEAILGQSATPETVAAFRKELKLDLPPYQRYMAWMEDVAKGNLGNSLSSGRPVSEMIMWRIENTFFLASSAAVIAVPLAIFLGILSALFRNSFFDKLISITTLGAISFPEFFIAYILIALFSVKLGIFPSLSNINNGMTFWHKINAIALPCITLVMVVTAHMMRQTRAAIINILSSAYIEMATLKGLERFRIIVLHALPNALSPVINVVALNLAYLVVGVVIVEVVFVFPGLGQLLVDSVAKRDLPVVQACGLIFAATYIGLNLLADILSIISNPRTRYPV